MFNFLDFILIKYIFLGDLNYIFNLEKVLLKFSFVF